MADDIRKSGRPDRDRINVNEDYELRDWSKKLGVSKEKFERGGKTGWPDGKRCGSGTQTKIASK